MDATSKEKSPTSASCLGTKCIRFSGTTKEALLAIFYRHSNDGTDADAKAEDGQNNHAQQQEILRINVTDGVSVYQGEIDMDTVKMKLLHRNSSLANNKHKQATTLAGYLLQQEKSNTEGDDLVKADYVIQDDGEKVKLVIKYQHGSDEDGYMKKAWSGILEKQQDTNDSNNDSRNAVQNASLSFFKILGDTINQGRLNVEVLQSEKKQLQKDGEAWKDTAQKLEGTWQREKDTVFKNFSTLYNKTKKDLDKALKEIRKLQDREQNMSMLALQNAKTPAIFEEEEMPDQPDDYDHNLHDEEMVELLAAGKPYDIKSKKKNSDKATATNKRAKLIKIKKEAASEEEKKEPTFDDSDTSSDLGGGGKKGPAKRKLERGSDSDSDDDGHRSTRRAIL